jgi:hypothetical protein
MQGRDIGIGQATDIEQRYDSLAEENFVLKAG